METPGAWKKNFLRSKALKRSFFYCWVDVLAPRFVMIYIWGVITMKWSVLNLVEMIFDDFVVTGLWILNSFINLSQNRPSLTFASYKMDFKPLQLRNHHQYHGFGCQWWWNCQARFLTPPTLLTNQTPNFHSHQVSFKVPQHVRHLIQFKLYSKSISSAVHFKMSLIISILQHTKKLIYYQQTKNSWQISFLGTSFSQKIYIEKLIQKNCSKWSFLRRCKILF